ncbi:MAG: tRNA guanosine(34) transglycosylase Tgt [Verrucomicrobia bacterium GWF2_51_19]|nr:MAG: tRNA guanosine(34) transglycosylase Tgt [Verrucomicrobia bacterium GWF2_51_19]HCJ11599.1 tRNA guanosine(34) transglycosylase Tgt [Opitutae bacterium]
MPRLEAILASPFRFEVTHRDPHSKARCGRIHTPHGVIETPNFIFCATKGAIKGVAMEQVMANGAEIILSNTYHMLLQPGPDVVAAHGGLHKFLGWDGPMLTDSGGFQIFSLGHGGVANEIKGRGRANLPKTLLKITEEGALFRSYIDGSLHTLTPESSIEAQQKLGADLILVLDECTPFHSDRAYTAKSMRRSHRWEQRSLDYFRAHDDGRQALYGIVQGGIYEDLRKESGQFVAGNDFFGQAIGGSLGGTREQMHDIVEMVSRYIHPERPTHLLGIGGVADIENGVRNGIDTFDCVHPTRLARHGCALVPNDIGDEHINLKNTRFKNDLAPIDSRCNCYCCRNFSRAYIHHLFKAKETTGGLLLTLHNIAFMSQVVRNIREQIKKT